MTNNNKITDISRQKDERVQPLPSDKELYNASDIKKFIDSERRYDQLMRLNEVRKQSSIWIKTVIVATIFNLILIGLALYGMATTS